MALEPKGMHENATSQLNRGKELALHGTDDKGNKARLPKWTRQETMVLINGKNAVESRDQGGQRSIARSPWSDQNESKWGFISSYCKQHGADRGPLQCQKRWSAVVGDFRKIKTWESQIKEEAESYWMMNRDLRLERKLPGFYDREVYDVMDVRLFAAEAFPLASVTAAMNTKKGDGDEAEAAAAEEKEKGEDEDPEAIFDSHRPGIAELRLFRDLKQSRQEKINLNQNAEKAPIATESPRKTDNMLLPISDIMKEHPGSSAWTGSMTREGMKRRRPSPDGGEDPNPTSKLVKVLESNSNMLKAQFEAHNANCQADRAQRKEDTDSLVTALSKLSDALVGIAEKL